VSFEFFFFFFFAFFFFFSCSFYSLFVWFVVLLGGLLTDV